jgi:hypothetical protein
MVDTPNPHQPGCGSVYWSEQIRPVKCQKRTNGAQHGGLGTSSTGTQLMLFRRPKEQYSRPYRTVTRLLVGCRGTAIILCGVCQRQHHIAEGIAASSTTQNKPRYNNPSTTDLSELCRSGCPRCELPVQQWCSDAAVSTLTPDRLSGCQTVKISVQD